MSNIVNICEMIFYFLKENVTDILLVLGTILCLRYILIMFGFDVMLLALGVLMIFASLIIEINKKR